MFIELTDPNNGDAVLVNTAHTLSVHNSDEYGQTVVKILHSGGVQTLLCAESYDQIKVLLKG